LGFLGRGQKKNDEEDGSFEFSVAGLCKCMMCTHPKGSEEKLRLERIETSLEKMNRRMDEMAR
jgi:chitin synthase